MCIEAVISLSKWLHGITLHALVVDILGKERCPDCGGLGLPDKERIPYMSTHHKNGPTTILFLNLRCRTDFDHRWEYSVAGITE